MNKLAPLFLLISIVFTSCSSNQTEVLNDTPEKLLQSYTLKRDASGAYSIDFNTTNNTDVVTVKDTDKSNNIILYEVNHKTNNKHNNNFLIENDQLKIGFLEANKSKKIQISIEDENITLAKGTVTEFLNSYSINANENGTYQLDFKVNDNVITEFIYNNDIESYEIHLSKGNSKQKFFSRELTKKLNKKLKLNFVNYKYQQKASENMGVIIKPKVIIGDEDDA